MHLEYLQGPTWTANNDTYMYIKLWYQFWMGRVVHGIKNLKKSALWINYIGWQVLAAIKASGDHQ